LTAEGAAFYERGIRILDDMDTAEREAAAGATPRGRLRVNVNVLSAPTICCRWCRTSSPVIPISPSTIALTDAVVDLLEERADVAIRVGPLRESRWLHASSARAE